MLVVASSSSKEEEEEEDDEMQRHRRPLVITDLEARVFGDRAPRTPLTASDTPAAAAPGSSSAAVADASTPAPNSPPSTGVR
ncbi:hypothetical protein MRB53_028676 [Persea americana]|uniref:Uncharacterized protein n=1 Tax=Persea americana TaxID=3435 RepID=A0ACC2KGP4_PERAE|nr:hypothetical protein MRB53_028676 [Persea americana]